MYYVEYKKWHSIRNFQQPALLFDEKNGGYCPFPKNTQAFKDYWEEVIHYIHEGITYEGQRIAGLHFLYLNFCPIKNKAKKNQLSFPDFWASDADHFLEVEEMMALGPWKNVPGHDMRQPVWLQGKTRQCGSSLKGVVPLLYNMNMMSYTTNYLTAWLDAYNQKTLNVYLEYHNHNYRWAPGIGRRFMEKEKGSFYKTGFFEKIDGEMVPAGKQSTLSIVSLKDKEEGSVGGGADLIIVEESALHPKIDSSLKFMVPMVKDGDLTTGAILCYGAVGKDEQSSAFQRCFWHPRNYRAKAYVNIYDEKPIHKECGHFVPNYACRKGHIDRDGNPNPESAIQARDLILRDMTDKQAMDLERSQFCNSPMEMFASKGKKRFPAHLLDRAILHLDSLGFNGDRVVLIPDPASGRISWRYATASDPPAFVDFPYENYEDDTGCVIMYEPPPEIVIPGTYIAAIDSYNQQNSEWTSSKGCIHIFKKVEGLAEGTTNRMLVAEYIGRPSNKYDFYETCKNLLLLYGAVAMPENEDSELVPWFVNNHVDELLADQPDIIKAIVPNSKVKRLKGIHAEEHLIIAAENKIDRYLRQKLGTLYNDQGEPTDEVFGVSRILSVGLLKELRDYTHESNLNFDRVRTFGWLLLYEEETMRFDSFQNAPDHVQEFLTQTSRFGSANSMVPGFIPPKGFENRVNK